MTSEKCCGVGRRPCLKAWLHDCYRETKEVSIAALNAKELPDRENDPVMEMLDNAPWDDEPVTEEDRESLRIGREEREADLTVSAEEIKRMYGYEPQPAR